MRISSILNLCYSYACTLFHSPYPVSPLLATHTKTALCTNNSHFGSPRALRGIRRASLHALSFQALTNCPFRNPFLLMTMQTAGGVGCLAEFSSHSEPRTINLSVCGMHNYRGVERGSASQNWLSVQDGPKLDLGAFGTRSSLARGD